jgi:hypothetical protein
MHIRSERGKNAYGSELTRARGEMERGHLVQRLDGAGGDATGHEGVDELHVIVRRGQAQPAAQEYVAGYA